MKKQASFFVNYPSCQSPSLVESSHPASILKLPDLSSPWLDSCTFVHQTELLQCQTSARQWSNNSVTFHVFHKPHRHFFLWLFFQGIFRILQARARVKYSCPNLSTLGWILDPEQEDPKAIDIQHGHSVPFSLSNHCIIMVSHGQLNIY